MVPDMVVSDHNLENNDNVNDPENWNIYREDCSCLPFPLSPTTADGNTWDQN
jgi:hypothetical protein